MTLTEARHIHFIGIGGIGISALAKWAVEQGMQVSGSDLKAGPTTVWLAAHSCNISIGPHVATNIPVDCDLVIHTVAVQVGNAELDAAAQRGVPVLSYPQALNQLLATGQGIAVAGTHGKSTTTALLAYILVAAQRDPTVIIGTRVRLFDDTNERIGKGPDVLIEADEYNKGILLYHPKHAVVLNVDHEHVDIYPTLADLQKAFQTFVANVPTDGTLTLNADDPATPLLRKAARAKVLTFGLHAADCAASNNVVGTQGLEFTVAGLYDGKITTKLFGDHNVLNILAALSVAHSLDIPFATCQKAIAEFPGTWRRFEYRGQWRGATIIDDYAHHPTEIRATLQAARQAFPKAKMHCVFQPHLHSRTAAFASAFAKALQAADACTVVEVYDVAGRDESTKTSSAGIAAAIGPDAYFAKDIAAAVTHVAGRVQPGDVVLTLGAGDVTNFASIAQKENPSI